MAREVWLTFLAAAGPRLSRHSRRAFDFAFGGRWRRRTLNTAAAAFSVFALLIIPAGSYVLTPARHASVEHRYDIIQWHLVNFGAKWAHRVGVLLPWNSNPVGREDMLAAWFDLTDEVRRTRTELNRAAAVAGTPGGADVSAIQERLTELERERLRLRNALEEYLEAEISAVLRQQGLNAVGMTIWPPVDFRLDATPRVLVTSPRERIERREDVLIDPYVTVPDMDAMEERLLAEHNLSGIVLPTGGVATYPNVIPHDIGLRPMLEVAAHEWLHAYLFFFPLGQAMFANHDMWTLNETLATLAGRELGDLTYEAVTGEQLPPPPPPGPPPTPEPGAFDYFHFMRETRLTTDELLAAGEIERAEQYMEERRVELQEHGIFIRKLNQAYFAFHGTYAHSPGSVSPIADQLEELRSYHPDIGSLVREMRGVSSIAEFEALLEGYRSQG